MLRWARISILVLEWYSGEWTSSKIETRKGLWREQVYVIEKEIRRQSSFNKWVQRMQLEVINKSTYDCSHV